MDFNRSDARCHKYRQLRSSTRTRITNKTWYKYGLLLSLGYQYNVGSLPWNTANVAAYDTDAYQGHTSRKANYAHLS